MSESIALSKKSQPARKPRAWWQWLVGIILIGIAIYSLSLRWLLKNPPEWFLGLNSLRSTPLVLPEGMKESDVVPASPGSLAGYNVLLVTLDTTRSDRIGCYGNKKIETPIIDGLAKSGVLFSNAFAVGPTTLPSHCSIMTGLYPYHHEARANGFTRLSEDRTTLAEALSNRGYDTAGFISAFVLDSRFGIAQGFSEYDDHVDEKLDPVATIRDPERRANHTTDRAIDWLRKRGDKPFFTWVHYFDPHQPYIPPPEYAGKYKNFLYDGEIAFTDSEIGRLLGVLQEMKAMEKTLVVVTADHGQGFLQHLELTHGLFVYDSTLHVPFIMSCGTHWGGVHVSREVSGVDVMPTILSLLGVEVPKDCDGVDLTRPPSSSPRAIYSETLEGLDEYAVAPLMTVREGSMKYIFGPAPELYDLSRDPDEEQNIIADHSEKASAFKDRLSSFYDNDLAKAAYVQNAEQLTPEELAQLHALGYIGGEGGALVPSAGSLPDPKSVVNLISKCERAWEVKESEGVEAAIRHLQSIVEEAPDYYAAHRLMSTFLLDAREYELAKKSLERCLEIHPDIPFPFLHLARVHFQMGNVEESIKFYERTLRACPDSFSGLAELGKLQLRRNRPKEAAKYLKKAVMIRPTDQSCIEQMAMAMAQAGEAEEAISLLRSRLQKNPELNFARNSLCGLLMEQNKCDEIIPLMREGLKRDPDSLPMINNLAYAIIKCKRPDEPMVQAAIMMERVCEKTNYQSPEYLRTLGMVYGELLRVDEAIAVTEKALKLTEEKNDPRLTHDLKQFLALYREMKAKGASPMIGVKSSKSPSESTTQPTPNAP